MDTSWKLPQQTKIRFLKTWIRKQTLANSERYITPELKEFEEKIPGSGEKIKQIEHALFIELREDANYFA